MGVASQSRREEARLSLVASWIVVFLVTAQSVTSMLSQSGDRISGPERYIGSIGAIVSVLLFLVVQRRVITLRPHLRSVMWLLFIAASCAFVCGAWLNAGLFAAGLALDVTWVRCRRALAAYAAGLVGFMLVSRENPVVAMFYLLIIGTVGLVLYVLSRMAIIVVALAQAQETVTRLQVDDERHRISRDLHDLLGRGLVAVSLRIQTAIRLLRLDPEGCGSELDQVARLVANGQAELRQLTRGEPVIGLAQEIETTEELFSRLGVVCVIRRDDHGGLDQTLDQLLARIIRESVTNCLKHSRPRRLEISACREFDTMVLSVVNDGAPASSRPGGTGLSDLADRVAHVGGSLEAGHESNARFRVIARLPECEVTRQAVRRAPSQRSSGVTAVNEVRR